MYKKQFGFTLIEIVVAVGLMIILMTVGITAYMRFETRQQLVGTKKEIEAIFHRARNNAKTGKMGNCSKLKAYQVDGVNQTDNFELQMREVCQTTNTSLATVYTSPDGVKLNQDFSLYFRVLSGDVDNVLYRYYDHNGDPIGSPPPLETDWTIVVTDGDQSYQFTITRSGEINQGSWL